MSFEDQHQDIARSSYADMLNDDERNRAYDEAIRICVNSLVMSRRYNPGGSRLFKCCDIGTGSGLLSMMIVRAFQELRYDRFHVTAFEAFRPMANCARRVIDLNGMSEFITVLPIRSDQYNQNPKFDLLVAELLDTELIGEGCIDIYRHAIEKLCSPECLFVPYKARIYTEPVASSFLFERHSIDELKFDVPDKGSVTIQVAAEVRDCCGRPEIDDMQASNLRENVDFIRISEPKVAFEFVFNSLDSLARRGRTKLDFPIQKLVDQPPVLVMWWDIVMYNKTNLPEPDCSGLLEPSMEVLSCAPIWARSEELLRRDQMIRELYGRGVWREHWIQGVYYFKDVIKTRKLIGEDTGSHIVVAAHHDTHSLWFDLDEFTDTPASCVCGVHRGMSRTQLAFLSGRSQLKKLIAALIYKAAFPIQGLLEFRVVLSQRDDDESFGAKWRIHLQDRDGQPMPFSLVDLRVNGEFPWETVLHRFMRQRRTHPVSSFVIKCTQVKFEDLYRIRKNIKDCEGFNLDPLDDMVEQSSQLVDKALEFHYLWEYNCKLIGREDQVIYSSSMNDTYLQKVRGGTFWKNIRLPAGNQEGKDGMALVFWAEFTLENTREVISTGPVNNSPFEWNRYCKQAVYFLHDYPTKPGSGSIINLDVGFDMCKLIVQRAVDYNTVPAGPARGASSGAIGGDRH